MLDLPDVTLLAIDTVNHALALRALARSCENIRFARALLLTADVPRAVIVPRGIDIEPIEPMASREAYSAFVLKGLREHLATSHVLLVQWDGHVINPDAWDPAFLACDYIGAKWFWQPEGSRVGNGGFSLRSRRLLDALQDPRIVLQDVEDLTICHAFRPLLEREHGIRFATEAQADRFAFEAAHPIGRPFGFHGLFNFARVLPPDELAALAPAFSDAIAASPQLAQLVRNCIASGQWRPAVTLADRRLAALPGDAESQALHRQAEAGARQAPSAGRNDPCPCGSGRRYKHCHGALDARGSAPSPAALADRALSSHRRGDLDAAERDYRTVLAQAPEHPLALHYLGVIAYQQGRAADALPLLERAAALAPGEPEFHNNLGLALAALERPDDAVAAYRGALARNPSYAVAWSNLGLALTAGNALPEAIAALRRAVALAPDYGEAHWNLALALLADGQFDEGWREYEWRLRLPVFQAAATVSGDRWEGGPLDGRTLLVTAEQGLGDTLHFARFAATLAARGARVIIEAPRPLVHLLATVPGVADVRAQGDAQPLYDAQVPLLSVPGALRVDAATIPGTVPYLAADPARTADVRAEVDRIADGRQRVGIAWAGARNNPIDRLRSCPLAMLASLFEVPGMAWFSLQKGEAEDEIAGVADRARLARLDARNDFDGTAALVAALDLVITVDTSIAHLAGALARPTWIMLPFASDWRWRQVRRDSPWYPTVRLFRQPQRGDWASVATEVAAALAKRQPETQT